MYVGGTAKSSCKVTISQWGTMGQTDHHQQWKPTFFTARWVQRPLQSSVEYVPTLSIRSKQGFKAEETLLEPIEDRSTH